MRYTGVAFGPNHRLNTFIRPHSSLIQDYSRHEDANQVIGLPVKRQSHIKSSNSTSLDNFIHMAPNELLALRLCIDHRGGLYGSEFVHLTEGRLTRGTVYTLLDRLVDKGLLTEVEEPATARLRLARTKHKITAQGLNAYNAFLREQGLQMAPFAPAGI